MTEKGKLLIVEDNPGYAARAMDVIPGDLLFAFDLEQAKAYLAEGGLSGVITDMNFAHRGSHGRRSTEKKEYTLYLSGVSIASTHPIFSHTSYLEVERASVRRAFEWGYEFEPTVIAEEGEKRVILEKLLENRPLLRRLRHIELSHSLSMEEKKRIIDEDVEGLEALLESMKKGEHYTGETSLGYAPPAPFIDQLYPLGFFVIEEAKRQELPVVTVTSIAHSSGSLVLLAALGMADESSLVNAFQVLNNRTYSREPLLGSVILGKSEKAYAQAYGHLQRLGLKSSME